MVLVISQLSHCNVEEVCANATSHWWYPWEEYKMRFAFGYERQRNWDKCDKHAAIYEKSIGDAEPRDTTTTALEKEEEEERGGRGVIISCTATENLLSIWRGVSTRQLLLGTECSRGTGNKEWGMGNEQQGVRSEEWGMGNEKRALLGAYRVA